MKLRKDKAPASPSPKLKAVNGQPLAPPTPLAAPTDPAAPEEAIHIPDSLAKTFRVTAGSTDAVMAVVMVRGNIPELLEAYDHYEQSVDQRGGPDSGLVLHVCSPTADGICVIDVWESESAFKAWVLRTPGQRVPKLYPVHGMRITENRPNVRSAPTPPAPPPKVKRY
jgi:heme-degrading monooxygenase HmoA